MISQCRHNRRRRAGSILPAHHQTSNSDPRVSQLYLHLAHVWPGGLAISAACHTSSFRICSPAWTMVSFHLAILVAQHRHFGSSHYSLSYFVLYTHDLTSTTDRRSPSASSVPNLHRYLTALWSMIYHELRCLSQARPNRFGFLYQRLAFQEACLSCLR